MMLDITADDIAALNDEDLRTLVGRLCEAALRRRSLPSSAVTWGGNQTAKDGGLDVRVALPSGAPIDGFVPRPATGFQVKTSDMPHAAIIDEMKPKGILRPAIVELAKASGAYVVVSSTGSTSDSALQRRREAMAEAVRDLPAAANLTLDFYDRNRMATWVRDHPGLIPWVRSRIGRSIQGWLSYGSWSHAPAGADQTYLTDERACIRTGSKDEGDGLCATDGINAIRDVLRTPGGVVRLIGLSGVGKTRLAEALFDPTVGAITLDPSGALYTDVAQGPDPQPAGLASDLIAGGMPAILVIDNCPPDVHRQLSEVARSVGTTISIITIEYDIREDQPEGSDVFVLDTSSPSVIAALVARRHSNVSQIDARTIAEFSGGNARVALALAGTVAKNETIAGLSDDDLFRRLFQQRHDSDPSLLSMAQACSLVYSFEGARVSEEGAELPILAALIGRSPEAMFGAAAELKRRELLQERGPWRAVLPHAIANRLAATALQNIPPAALAGFVERAPARLLRSFSRRLGYLHGSKEARAIVESWLAPGGLLGNLGQLNELGRAMFSNIAPAAPNAVLCALEDLLGGLDETTLRQYTHFIPLLRSLAYDATRFERAVSLLARFARLPSKDHSLKDAASIVASLFQIVLSGTHASVELRLTVVSGLLGSLDPAERELGAKALQAMFMTSRFSSPYGFEFGAHSRNYGYHPKTGEAVRDWLATILKLAEKWALSDGPSAELVRNAMAQEFRGLWANSGNTVELARLSLAIADKTFWREGWIAARQTRIYNGKALPPESLLQLTELEEVLRPNDLVNRVRGLVLGSRSGSFDIDDLDFIEDDDYAGALERSGAAVESLGRDVAVEQDAFGMLLPELMGAGEKLGRFGRGLALGAERVRELWSALVAQVGGTANPGVAVLCGFLEGLQKRDPILADALLDQALEDPALGEWFPFLQASVTIDQAGTNRLLRALERGTAPIMRFMCLAYGRISDAIPGAEFKRLVLAIGSKQDGLAVALEILSMRLHADRNDKRGSVPEVAEAGRTLLAAYQFHRGNGRAGHEDYGLGVIILASLADQEGRLIARKLCCEFLAAAVRHEVHAHDHSALLEALFQVHPVDMLDELFAVDDRSRGHAIRLLNDLLEFRKSPLESVPDEVIIGWCDKDPKERYPFAAAVALLIQGDDEKPPHEWTSLARQLLQRAPDAPAVLAVIVRRLHLSGWSGSLATVLESRLKLLEQLNTDGVPLLAAALGAAKVALKRRIEDERRRETEEDRASSERFE